MKTELDTPRTDEKEKSVQHCEDIEWGSTGWELARQLEQELNAAMQAIRDIYANEYNSSETYTICEKILPKEEHLKP